MVQSHLAWIVMTQAWQLTALAALVWVATQMFARDRPHLAYLLWLVVLLKCVTPPIWSSPSGMFCWLQSYVPHGPAPVGQPSSHPGQRAWASEAEESVVAVVAESRDSPLPHSPLSAFPEDASQAIHPQAATGTGDNRQLDRGPVRCAQGFVDFSAMRNVLLRIWLAGTVTWAAWMALRYTICWNRLKACRQSDLALLNRLHTELCGRLGIRRKPRLLVTSAPVGPAIIGLWRPAVVLPGALIKHQQMDALAPILAHELIHIRRGDGWVGLLQLVTRALWWFHPLVWLANRRATCEAERACDEEVIAELGLRPGEYARRLLNVLELKRSLKTFPALAGVRPADITTKRLERIMRLEHGCIRRTPWWCWMIMLAAACATLPGAAFVVLAEEQAKPPVASEQPEGTPTAPPPTASNGTQADTRPITTLRAEGDGVQLQLEMKDWRIAVRGVYDATIHSQGGESELVGRNAAIKIASRVGANASESALNLQADQIVLQLSGHSLNSARSRECTLRAEGHVKMEWGRMRVASDRAEILLRSREPSEEGRSGDGEGGMSMRLEGNVQLQDQGVDGATIEAQHMSLEINEDVCQIMAAYAAWSTIRKQRDIEPDAPLPGNNEAPSHDAPGVTVLGPVLGMQDGEVPPPPTDTEIIEALAKNQSDDSLNRGRKNIRIVKELIADYYDPPRYFPLLGPGRLHHAHYKCTVYSTRLNRVGWPVPHSSNQEVAEVIYVDHQHIDPVATDETPRESGSPPDRVPMN